MEKFLARNLVVGHSPLLTGKKVQLVLPIAKHYEVHAVKNGEDELHEETLLEVASSRKKSEVCHIWQYVSLPGDDGAVPRTLQLILTKTCYPLLHKAQYCCLMIASLTRIKLSLFPNLCQKY